MQMKLGAIRGWISNEKLAEAEEAEAVADSTLAVAVACDPPAERPAPSRPASPLERWPAPRVAAVEALWGAGFTAPGGATEAIRLVKPLGLTSKATLLLVGGGIGGPAHAIASAFGTWVGSYEAEPALAAIATQRMSGVMDQGASRVTSSSWNRLKPQFQPRSANHALALEALRGAPASPFLSSVAGALRPYGQIVMTELVADLSPVAGDREFAAWCRLENRLPELPRPAEVSDALGLHRFDVRVMEDISDRHVTQTLAGWREAVRGMETGPKPVATQAAAFVTEAELWLLRIRLMRRLGFRLMRWHAIATA